MRIAVFSTLVLLASSTVSPVLAERPASDGFQLSLGAGLFVSPRPYVGADAEIFPIPVLDLRYKSFFFEGVRTGFRGQPVEHLEMSIFAAMRFDGAEPDDSAFLAQNDGKPSTALSGSAGVRPDELLLSRVSPLGT